MYTDFSSEIYLGVLLLEHIHVVLVIYIDCTL